MLPSNLWHDIALITKHILSLLRGLKITLDSTSCVVSTSKYNTKCIDDSQSNRINPVLVVMLREKEEEASNLLSRISASIYAPRLKHEQRHFSPHLSNRITNNTPAQKQT